MSLVVHVFGGSKGESIVLQFPDNSWGLVDCYSSSISDISKNPVAQFLKSEGVDRLSFVCLTHGHDDHFIGLRQIFSEFDVSEFWYPNVMTTDRLADLLKAKIREEKRVVIRTGGKTNSEQLASLWEEIGALREKGLNLQKIGMGTVCVPTEAGRKFTINGIGPSEKQGNKFEEKLEHCFTEDGEYKWNLKHRDVNYSSIGLLVQYGSTRLILGGDIEEGGWQDLLDERPFLVGSANFVKIAHHGSENGYCENLWQKHAEGTDSVIKVLTPFKTYDLPARATIEHITSYDGDLYSAGFPFNGTEFSPTYVSSLAALSKKRKQSSAFDSRVDVTFDDEGNATDVGLHGLAQIIPQTF